MTRTALVFLAACGIDSTATPDAHLDLLVARAELHQVGRDLRVDIVSPDCSSLASTTFARLDGELGVASREGVSTTDCSDFGHCDDSCVSPSFTWTQAPADASMIEIMDGAALWTIVVDHPAQPRTFALGSSNVLHSGDPVTVQLAPDRGTITQPAVAIGTTFVAASAITIAGSALQFTMPTITTASTATLTATANVAVGIFSCVGPTTCTESVSAMGMQPVMLAP